MNLNRTDQARRRRRRPGLIAALAGVGILAIACGANAQVKVQTIGGGVRAECESPAGFVAGNTYDTAKFNCPFATALDASGNLWLADKTNSDVEEITLAGNLVSSITSHTAPSTAPGNDKAFTDVNGVALDAFGDLYVLLPSIGVVEYQIASPTLNKLAEVSFASGLIGTAMLVDFNSNVFVAFSNGDISRFDLSAQTSATVVSAFNWQPAGMTLCANGMLAVSDTLNDAIYLVNTNTGVVTLLTGGNGAGYQEGGPAFAKFQQPHGLAASADGRIVVCDTGNNRVRIIDTLTNTSLLYGSDTNVWPHTCCSCDPALYAGWVDGTPGAAYNSAAGRGQVSVTIAPSGTLFITELYYDIIRSVTGSGLTPVNLAATPAAVVTLPATGITPTNATLNGTINPGGDPAAYYFEWGLTTNYTNFSTTNYLTANLAEIYTVAFQTLTNNYQLSPNTTYHYRLVATNALGFSAGGDVAFVTLPMVSTVTTLPATNITAISAVLGASVNPQGEPVSVYFQWGLSTNFGNLTASTNLISNLNGVTNVSLPVANLLPNTLYFFEAVAVNSAGTITGNEEVFTTLPATPPIIAFSPNSGYFPECQLIAITSTVPNVFYTIDGSTPTTGSAAVAMTNISAHLYGGSFLWCNPMIDLSALRILAFDSNSGTSAIVAGNSPPTNLVGFPQSFASGPGATAYIPVVVDLASNALLKSLQFLVEINQNSVSTPPITSVALQPLTPNDLVPYPGPAPGNTPVAFEPYFYTTSSNGMGVVITADAANNAGLNMQSSGVAVLLAVQIPPTATVGQSYNLNVLYPSATSNGIEGTVTITNMASQTLTLSAPRYMVGDSAPANGYNAGAFGNDILNNSDVNNAIYASMNIRVPPANSDLFNAMDAYPPTSVSGKGGDGAIHFLDWATILDRSLGGVAIFAGLDTNNYERFWAVGANGWPSNQVIDWSPSGPPATLSISQDSSEPELTKLSAGGKPPGLVWLSQASVRAGTVVGAIPGSTYSLPVSVNILPGYSLAGLQFRAIVTPNGGAPAVGQIQFNPAPGVPGPMILPGLSPNDLVHAWAFGSFAAPLQNSNYLGTISFQVPPGAVAGDSYSLRFVGVDGAVDFTTPYQLESFPGALWVMSAALQPPSLTSDEWKTAFFGSITNALAADDADPDGDGAPNWQEYLAGTNPTNSRSVLQFSGATLNAAGLNGIGINWLTAPGKVYVLESSPAVQGAAWSAVHTNTGDGNACEWFISNYSGSPRFYKIRVQP